MCNKVYADGGLRQGAKPAGRRCSDRCCRTKFQQLPCGRQLPLKSGAPLSAKLQKIIDQLADAFWLVPTVMVLGVGVGVGVVLAFCVFGCHRQRAPWR